MTNDVFAAKECRSPCLAYILLGCGACLGRIFVRCAYQRSSGVGGTKINIIAQLEAAPGLPEVSPASDPSFYPSYRHVCRRFLLVWPSAPRRNTGACAKHGAPVAARSVIRPVSAVSTTSIRRHQKVGETRLASPDIPTVDGRVRARISSRTLRERAPSRKFLHLAVGAAALPALPRTCPCSNLISRCEKHGNRRYSSHVLLTASIIGHPPRPPGTSGRIPRTAPAARRTGSRWRNPDLCRGEAGSCGGWGR